MADNFFDGLNSTLGTLMNLRNDRVRTDQSVRASNQQIRESDHRMRQADNANRRAEAESAERVKQLQAATAHNALQRTVLQAQHDANVNADAYGANARKAVSDSETARFTAKTAEQTYRAALNKNNAATAADIVSLTHDSNGQQLDAGAFFAGAQQQAMVIATLHKNPDLMVGLFGEGREPQSYYIKDGKMVFTIKNRKTGTTGPETIGQSSASDDSIVVHDVNDIYAQVVGWANAQNPTADRMQGAVRDQIASNPAVQQAHRVAQQGQATVAALGQRVSALPAQIEAARSAAIAAGDPPEVSKAKASARTELERIGMRIAGGENSEPLLARKKELEALLGAPAAPDMAEATALERQLGAERNAFWQAAAQTNAAKEQLGAASTRARLVGNIGDKQDNLNAAYTGTPYAPSSKAPETNQVAKWVSTELKDALDFTTVETDSKGKKYTVKDTSREAQAKSLVMQYINTRYGGDVRAVEANPQLRAQLAEAAKGVLPGEKTLAPALFRVSVGWSAERYAEEVKYMPREFSANAAQERYLKGLADVYNSSNANISPAKARAAVAQAVAEELAQQE